MRKISFVCLFLLSFASLFLLKMNIAAQSAGADARATIRAQMVEFLRYTELEKTVFPADVDRLVELWMSAGQPELSLEARLQAFRDLYLLYYKAHGVDLSDRPQAMSALAQRAAASIALAQRAAASMQNGARLDLRLPTPRGPFIGEYLHVVTQGRGKEQMLLIADGGVDGRELYRSFVTRHKDCYTMHIVTLPGAGSAKMMPWPEVYDLTRRPWINHKPRQTGDAQRTTGEDENHHSGALLFPIGEVPGRAEIEKLLNTPNNAHPTVQNWMAFAVKDEALSKAWTLEALSNGFFAPGLRFGFELQTTDLTEDLKQLSVPMLAMCATPDEGSPRNAPGGPLLSAPAWQEVKSLYPHIPLSVALYHDTRPYISEDSPREFDRDLSDFLAGKPVAGIAVRR